MKLLFRPKVPSSFEVELKKWKKSKEFLRALEIYNPSAFKTLCQNF
ncbi:hypothetical protein [Desulfurobacterium indicum]|nr:hypothetical protein [Desulfurobacterium indicum]